MGKTRGMGAGRKLKTHRRRQRWADKAYKKSHLGNEWKKPFAGSSHAKGIVLEKIKDVSKLSSLTLLSESALESS
ncbi:small ribosomal subunit protein uS12-like [Musa acuminata AAA Group]|uniref:small ribosomal subunit protein uS12-like n=1 Tax=Musa acuminata AAA Group TaxID=214697 RepID=UPI0031D28D57